MIKTLKTSVSTICKQVHWEAPEFRYACDEILEIPRFHRKQWEYVFILNNLKIHNKLREGCRGLGFGCGTEPLGQVFTKYCAEVVLTDAPDAGNWSQGNQYSSKLENCFKYTEITSREHFYKYATHRAVDMCAIPDDLLRSDFDFIWSSCALEHLGSLEAGVQFVKNAMLCLKPGGLAVHTTEYNLTSDTDTIKSGGYVLYRKQDIEKLVDEIKAMGHAVAPLDLERGNLPLDMQADATASGTKHVTVSNGKHEFTSIGLVIIK